VDPFGDAIRDYNRGLRRHLCFIERDDGVTVEEEIAPYLEANEGWTGEEKTALSEVGARVLDIGCGPGRHTLGLQESAFVVGLDASEPVLSVCRDRGGKNLVLGAAARPPFKEGSFDTLLLLGNGLGISGGMERTTAMLRDLTRILSEGGSVICHTTDPDHHESGIDAGYVEKNRAAGRPPGLLEIRVRYRQSVGPWFELLLLGPGEVRALLGVAGFRLQRTVEWGASSIYVARRGDR
jgi:SAM-dependent methyltransferase